MPPSFTAVATSIMELNAARPASSLDLSATQPRFEALKEDYRRHEAFSFLHTVAVSRGEAYTVPEIVVVGVCSTLAICLTLGSSSSLRAL